MDDIKQRAEQVINHLAKYSHKGGYKLAKDVIEVIQALQSENKRLREALEYFAAKKYTKNHYNGVYCERVDDEEPNKIAQAALQDKDQI